MKNQENSALIVVKDLAFNYPSMDEVLKGISLTINRGEFIAIVGHNGSGKSTLAKLIAGINDYKSGLITINGIKVEDKNSSSLRGLVGIVFQNPDNQFIGTSVEDDIAFGLENNQIKREAMDSIIEDVLDKVGMSQFRQREPVQLSGGQKQRVAIAGILALDTEILIMDEATSMLDPQGKSDINAVLTNIRRDNPEKTIIIITHDLEETLLADRVIVMNHGTIVLDGKPNEVYENEKQLREINLDVPFLYKLLNRLSSDGELRKRVDSLTELMRVLNEN